MKVGSLVICINDSNMVRSFADEIFPKKSKIYTIRNIYVGDCGQTFIRLEELINKKSLFNNGFREGGYLIIRFRELQPPMTIDLEEILTEKI